MNFEETAQNIIDLTLKAGASDCDVVLAKSYGKSISCRFQKIEDLDESNEKTDEDRKRFAVRQKQKLIKNQI